MKHHELDSAVSAHLRAAQYVRMSTEHQQYSPVNQSDAIAQDAALNGMKIVRTYSDHGKSGLDLVGRLGLRSLLDDVARGTQDFSALLVYDISRWGRFQDADESAHYEYVLKRAGISTHYCAEKFSIVSARFLSLSLFLHFPLLRCTPSPYQVTGFYFPCSVERRKSIQRHMGALTTVFTLHWLPTFLVMVAEEVVITGLWRPSGRSRLPG